MTAKQEYNSLLESGELLELYPELKGDWPSDHKRFQKLWDLNQEILNFDLDFEEEEYFDEYGDL